MPMLCPVDVSAGSGTTQPSSSARSAIASSISLIVTASSLIVRTHASSQGAGQSLPVNSGKLFVRCRRSDAVSQSPRCTRSFHSGIRFESGQPWWQNGTPQSMQRCACSRTRPSGACACCSP